MHKDEIPIDIKLVRQLVDAQFPQFANLSLRKLPASGSTNIQFRLGGELLVRLPRLPDGSDSIEKEAHWTPIIGRHLPVYVPEFVGVGQPAFDYSEKWLIVRWLDGKHPRVCNPTDLPHIKRSRLANELADVILALRRIGVPQGASTEPALQNYRGHALEAYDESMRRNIEQCKALDGLNLDLDAALALWESALEVTNGSEAGESCWYHGDLVAENLLLTKDRLTGVLDFGGLGVGDPTIDLHGAWELLDPPALETFRVKLGATDTEWLRGRAWALAVALMTFPYYWNTMPGRVKDRLAMARSVLADAR
ncbi:MAG: phosphotransferase [Chloroflexota bacterium]